MQIKRLGLSVRGEGGLENTASGQTNQKSECVVLHTIQYGLPLLVRTRLAILNITSCAIWLAFHDQTLLTPTHRHIQPSSATASLAHLDSMADCVAKGEDYRKQAEKKVGPHAREVLLWWSVH